MILLRKYCVFILMLIIYSKSFSQIFGGDPPSIKWKQINSATARIIFPGHLDSVARRILNVITFINLPTENTIGKKSKKINLVLQNETTVSNAYVSLAPYRSEFLLTPFQNSFELGSLPWPDQLSIHEYRHVQQYNNFNVGFSKIMYDIFGEEGQVLANNATIPNWFYEGDAVYNETNVSKQGRGSLPFFYNGYRALWMEGKHYSWMKLRNGSFKDFVPDHYPLGFMLVAYGREKYGDLFWKNVTHDAASFKGLFYPFQKAIKKYSGKNYIAFRNDVFNFFKKQFKLQLVKPEQAGIYAAYRDEEYPAFMGNDSIIFIKSSFKQIPEFILRSNHSDKKIQIRDYSIDNQFSYKNGKIIYATYRPDVRWEYRDYSDLRIIDITNGNEQTLTNHTKYFSPDISNDGKKVIAVDEASNTKCTLQLLDATNGKIIKTIPNPDHLFYTYPKFYTNNKIISAVRNGTGKMSLALINVNDGTTNYLLPFSYNVIGFPSIINDTVYFSYSYLKNDELFAYTFSDKKLWKINYAQETGIGKYQPSANDGSLVWSAFTAEGYRLKQVSKHDVQFEEITPANIEKKFSDFGIASLQKTNFNLLNKVPDDSFTITKYHKGYKLFNFHSIEPQASDPDYSLTLLGENILNTFQSQISFTYDRAEKFKEISFAATYGGWFPFLSAGINYTFSRRSLYHNNIIHFNELEPFAGFTIPLNFSKNRSFTFLNFGSQYVYDQRNFKGVYKDSLGDISYGYSSNFLSFTHQSQQAVQQIFPQFAQTINVTYKTPLLKYKGFQFVANANIYFPGFLKTHSLILNGAILRKDSMEQFNPPSGFPFSRGYSSINLFEMYKWGVNYSFPLAYPDAGFADIIYLLRVRANLFFDDTNVKDFFANRNKFTAPFRSAGTEIYFDTKWWNEASITFGLRYSRLLDDDLFGGNGRNRFEIILPVNIFNQ